MEHKGLRQFSGVIRASVTSSLRTPGLGLVLLVLGACSVLVLLSAELHPFPGTAELYAEGLMALLQISVIISLILGRNSLDLRRGHAWPMPLLGASSAQLIGTMIAATLLLTKLWVFQIALVNLWPSGERLGDLSYGGGALLSGVLLIIVLAPWTRLLLALLPQTAAILGLLLLTSTAHLVKARSFDSPAAHVLHSLLPSLPGGPIGAGNWGEFSLYCITHGGMIAGLSFAIDGLRRGSATPREHTAES